MPLSGGNRSSTGGKDKRQIAKAKYLAAKQGLGNHLGALYDEELDPTSTNHGKDDDIYEYVEESEYQKIVESRRQREDFVVDDDGLGYYDDGEEHLGDEAYDDNDPNNTNAGKKRSASTMHNNNGIASLTAKALKKVRAVAAATKKNKRAGGEEDDDVDHDNINNDGIMEHENSKNKNRSMWDFVNRGNHVMIQDTTVATTMSGTGNYINNNSNKMKRMGGNPSTSSSTLLMGSTSNSNSIKDVDALLEQLDDPTFISIKKKKKLASNSSYHQHPPPRSTMMIMQNQRSRQQQQQQQHHHHRQWTMSRGNVVPRKSHGGSNSHHHKDLDDDTSMMMTTTTCWDDDNNDDDNNNNNTYMSDDDNNNDNDTNHTMHDYDDGRMETQPTMTNKENPKGKKVHFHQEDGTHILNTSTTTTTTTTTTKGGGNNSTIDDMMDPIESVSSSEEIVPSSSAQVLVPPRRRRLGEVSGPARKALEKELSKVEPDTTPSISRKGMMMDLPTFQPDPVADEIMSANIDHSSTTTGDAATTTTGQIPLDSVLQKDTISITMKDGQVEQENSLYIDMYWMDLCERNGDIMLFGKIQYPPQSGQYISACAIITGNVRNLFVLPRIAKDPNTGESTIPLVYNEINELLQQKRILPKQVGATWAGKPVVRQYAFEDTTIPREKTEYLKVVYDTKYPIPDIDTCIQGGEHYSRILGTGTSILENFIIKRKLMGPCWIRIRQPQPIKSALSWCKVEFHIPSPKLVYRWDVDVNNMNLPPPSLPPVITVSLKIRTVIDPKTHKSQIVALSALCHRHVSLQSTSSTDESTTKHMTHCTIIRPLDMGTGVVPFFPRDMNQEVASLMPQLKLETHERTMLSRFFTQLGVWDPDVIVGHNSWGYDMEILLQRCIELNLSTAWSKLGRRRRNQLPSKGQLSSRKELIIAEAISGRLLCDTYLSAKELLHETTYSLTNLAATVLKTNRVEIEPVDIPLWYQSSKTIVQLALSTLVDAQLVQRLMFKLQILPLTTQLTCIAGNFWSHTLKSNRAERTEYLLLHEFHRLKYLPPEKKRPGKRGVAADGKAKYSGGLVLEPKKGLYDSFILLLDFNSLYPSIILEYNLCFTTMEWSRYQGNKTVDDNTIADDAVVATSNLPPIPDEAIPTGVLPKVIKSLVERRKAVKNLLKNESNMDKKQELDIRQKALKLTANSMYGCLGFSNSRFYAQPIAALVTSKGRETLQNAVNIAQNKLGLEVIYGDTDSIMINTRLNEESDLAAVKKLGESVKKEVNALYRTLELEVDGVFRSMLLLKKKKYAARTVEELPNGEIRYGHELKGLDLVRRDWCVQSKDTGRFVTDQILSGQDSELIRQSIFNHLEELATKMRSEQLPLEKYVITKGLSKHPNDYPDGKSLPHVQVAKMMLQNARPVNVGDHIPYVVTAPQEKEVGEDSSKVASAADRARHPEEIMRSNGALKPDIEWYLTQQILPPVSRLLEPIEGMSQNILAEKLGLDGSRYKFQSQSGPAVDEDIAIDYTPASLLPDKERFKDVHKLSLLCRACGVSSEFPGVFPSDATSDHLLSGLCCVNPDCPRPKFWGEKTHFDCYTKIANNILLWTRDLMTRYYAAVSKCDEPGCGLETSQLSVLGGVCLRLGCNGRMYCVVTEHQVHTHLKYLESLFDASHASEQLAMTRPQDKKENGLKNLSKHDRATFEELHAVAKSILQKSAYNWIPPSFWAGLPTVVKQ